MPVFDVERQAPRLFVPGERGIVWAPALWPGRQLGRGRPYSAFSRAGAAEKKRQISSLALKSLLVLPTTRSGL